MLNQPREQKDTRNASGQKTQPESGERAVPGVPSVFAVSLPKGGGAIKGMGEKFAANPVTGTGSMSVPLATSPGRSGFGPQLFLSYDSGTGNTPFGFGWSLSLPSLIRKTDKGLPRYWDETESDVFMLSGAEDLVPVYRRDASGNWVRDPQGNLVIHRDQIDGYSVHRYRPRIEGLFACIERWTRITDPSDIHWRSISKDNILTLYGKDDNSRLVDPEDPRRIFSWLLCETRDDKGNAVLYDYKPEDGTGVDLSRAYECNRGERNNVRRTANRYLKGIRYGNRIPLLNAAGQRPRFLSDLPPVQTSDAGWMFEVVFDYGEHNADAPTPSDAGVWSYRNDPFSTYRAGFEVRTTRLCQRVLMFHHFEGEQGIGNDCLVHSTDFTYSRAQNPDDERNPIYAFVLSVTQSGYKRQDGGYLKRSLPPVEFEYSQPVVQDLVEEVDSASLENLPIGVDGAAYQWTDLHGEGTPGIFTEQAGTWFYTRNLSPLGNYTVEFAPMERVAVKPNLALAGGQAQFMDLAGDGQPDLVVLDGPMPGLYEHDGDEGWQPFRPFTSRLNRGMRDANLRFVDLDGDGHADVLITEDDALVWHPSQAAAGFGPAQRVTRALDEEKGPRLVFADGSQSVYLADLSGDGLTDLVRVRNGEICYWPNLGYGRFGAKITMDHAPHFDRPDQFDHERIRLADIDGGGTTDIIYLHRDGVRLYFNQSGNSWSEPHVLSVFPRVDDLVSIVPTDLLGNGTACLVWSSPLPGDARRPMRYINLMGAQKPHLLVRTVNNLGAETRVQYVPSTKFYLQDKYDGKPWITKLPFPVHVVERVETYDHVSRNRFVTRHAYHHGYFDGEEREFRGFGMVEQWDTEEFAALNESTQFPSGTNIDTASHIPPVLTRTWFHTGLYLGRQSVSNFFAGLLNDTDSGEYYRPALNDTEASALLLDDTVLPPGLTLKEEYEASRSLKGAMLRQEVYALDGTDKEPHPYIVTEQNFTIRLEQPRADNRFAVFFTHARETLSHHYDRNPTDPRVGHALTLAVDDYGNALQSVAIGYGRRQTDPTLLAEDQAEQTQIFMTLTENAYTNPVDLDNNYRTPLPVEARTYELTDLVLPESNSRFSIDEVLDAASTAMPLAYDQTLTPGRLEKRLIEHVCTRYRPDDLGANAGDPLALLALGVLESRALPGEAYKLAFTLELLNQIYDSRVTDSMMVEGGYVEIDGDRNWWVPSGRVFYSPNTADTPTQELAEAQAHFFSSRLVRDPFGNAATVTLDNYDLLTSETRDPVGNVVTAVNDYRVLAPRLVTDPNGNRSEVDFDVLGMVAGMAVMGKPEENRGDTLIGFETDLTDAVMLDHLNTPLADPHAILQGATTRLVYDLCAYQRTATDPQPQPAVVYALVRETHVADLLPDQQTKIQHSFSYSDGFGREIQKKIQAEPGPLSEDSPDVSPRWVGSGWTVFNNKGKPVRQFEPFFTATHGFEFDVRMGVSPILCYDPLQRVVATLNPNRTWQKVAFDPWRQETWDVHDTVLVGDPKDDPDISDFFGRLPETDYLPTWYAQRIDGALGTQEQVAATKTAMHANTPVVAHMDSLGRTFLTIVHNKFKRGNSPPDAPAEEALHRTRVVFDIEGNQREVIDALERIVIRYDYDMLGNQVHSASMEAGERWVLNDAQGKPIRNWDSRDHTLQTVYDALRRPGEVYLYEGVGTPKLVQRLVYGEAQGSSLNHRGRILQHCDGAGLVTLESYDFKGNLLQSYKQFAEDYKNTVDWAVAPAMQAETFTTRTEYDALNRPVQMLTPDNSIVRPSYNEANLLERVAANLRGSSSTTVFVTDINYNARGQRERIEYGNGVSTIYDYDPLTFRLIRLQTLKGSELLQDLSYTYDPTGNITHIEDDAQQTIYFRNTQVEPSNDYSYDAIYQLIEATGREHLGQLGGQPNAPTAPDAFNLFHTGLDQPGDGNAMGRYLERYIYDAVGNFLEMQHVGSDPAHPGWTRGYAYLEPSLIEPGKTSNQLSSTQVGGPLEPYTYDAHGSMITMPHLPLMRWNYLDQLQASAQQVVNSGTPETTWYVYDAGGQRVRKVTERTVGQIPTRINERIYLGSFEIYREYGGNGGEIALERETLHVMDDQQRIALVETKTIEVTDGINPPTNLLTPILRYQISNHLGSACLELNDAGGLISYEEYYPYGATAYHAVDSSMETSLKRYRYTGKERDETTGLAYHGARYYISWLGRWCSTDPLGPIDSENLYQYVKGNPLRYIDENGKWTDQPRPDELELQSLEHETQRMEKNRQIFIDLMGLPKNAVVKGQSGQQINSYGESIAENAAGALIQAILDPQIQDVLAADLVSTRVNSVIDLTSNTNLAPVNFDAKAIGRTGDTGFREQFRDEGDQVGHFLSAVNATMNFPFSIRGIVGHEMEEGKGGGIIRSVTRVSQGFWKAESVDLQNFQKGRLNLIPVDDTQPGVSYEDLYLSYFGYRFGQMVDQGQFKNLQEAADWLTLILTPNFDLATISSSHPFYSDVLVLRQFGETQTQKHQDWVAEEIKQRDLEAAEQLSQLLSNPRMRH
ncbi:MAG: VCBS repeat-containing protein [Gemmatimonadaceae bacterium]|nr:VCBS repeat-containing protein [Gloeobacterales cyanobacterium ES-bin-141]